MLLKKNKTRILLLFSGGLDSMLAAKILKKQKNLEITGLSFVSYFFDAQVPQESAKIIKLPLNIFDFSDEHLGMLKKPKHGYGQSMNPCIDCHALMLKKAKEIMKSQNYDLVATGEVLGERPMSQNKQSLEIIAKESGLNGYLLRPLSAQLLEPTYAEKSGIVDREKLLNISGRSRQRQFSLARQFKIKKFPQPAGGCLLTDLHFGMKLKELFKKWPDFDGLDARLLKIGRHFWLNEDLIVLGRNHQENLAIKKLIQKNDVFIETKKWPGPSALIRSQTKVSFSAVELARDLILKYSPKAPK